MLPQSAVMVTAPIAAGHEDALTDLLAGMNQSPGLADPGNSLVPFGRFERLHYARFLILKDPTPDEIAVYNILPTPLTPTLAFFADCDGCGDAFLVELARQCSPGLRSIFTHCVGFGEDTDVLTWLRLHQIPIAATYINWMGRTVRQIRQEAALFDMISDYLDTHAAALVGHDVQHIHREVVTFVQTQQRNGTITLSPPEPTPLRWQVQNLLNLIEHPLIFLVASPFLLLGLPLILWRLRWHEKRDPEINARPDLVHRADVATSEDRDISNPYIVIGYLKPGLFRLGLAMVLLRFVEYGSRHVYKRGRLARVRSIHFARWVFVNDKKQVIFASTYDGSLDSYMDDFINKVGWGLNVLFSNSVGYPKTNWLLRDGASDEMKFKYDLFRHQVKVQVWYKAYPGLTLFDMYRNSLIRAGIEAKSMTSAQIHDWLDLL